MVKCITGARFTMNATVLRWVGETSNEHSPAPGTWAMTQDPITGEILNKWEPVVINIDNTATIKNEYEELTIPCVARGIVDGGIRVAGTTERFGDTYENIDYVKMWFPAKFKLTKRDRITNIRDKKNGTLIWVDEEYLDGTRATVFNVNGVTPLFDAFNKHTESFALLERV